jgi:hypothetical protein
MCFLLAVIQKAVMAICDARASFLTWSGREIFAGHEHHEGVVLFPAGRAALKVRPQPGDRSVGVEAGQLELDELVQPVEALLATDLPAGRPEQPLEALVVLIAHRLS